MITVIPKSKEEWLSLRSKNINSTEVSALFNCNPYMTHYELWHLKKGLIQDSFSENERTKWGTRLQDSIAYGVAEDRGWKIQKMEEYMYDPNYRIGSSFDFFIPILKETLQPALLEIKNVDSLAFKNGWIVDDNSEIESPLHIELQLQHQMFIAGFNKAYIAALVGGNTPVILERDRDEEVVKNILKKCEEFWKSIDMGIPPEPNFEKDFDTIKEVYKVAKKAKAIEGNSKIKELAEEYSRLNERAAEIDKKKESIKGQLLLYMSDAEYIIGDGFKVSAGLVSKKEHTVKSSVSRQVKVRFMEAE
jgi:putative phage-type endonuclease